MNDLRLITDSHTLSFHCALPGSAGWVWWHLTEPEGLRSWLADGQLDARLGGSVKLRFQSGEALVRSNCGVTVHGVISCYEPSRRLIYSWSDALREGAQPGRGAAGESSRVCFELAEGQGRTSLSLTHTGLRAQLLSKVGAGWHAHLRLLANVLSEDADMDDLAQSSRFVHHGSYVESFVPRMRA